jgi:hypothetical protein
MVGGITLKSVLQVIGSFHVHLSKDPSSFDVQTLRDIDCIRAIDSSRLPMSFSRVQRPSFLFLSRETTNGGVCIFEKPEQLSID